MVAEVLANRRFFPQLFLQTSALERPLHLPEAALSPSPHHQVRLTPPSRRGRGRWTGRVRVGPGSWKADSNRHSAQREAVTAYFESFCFLFILWCWDLNLGPHTLGKHSTTELHLQAQCACCSFPFWTVSRATPSGSGVPQWAVCLCQCWKVSPGPYVHRCFLIIRPQGPS